MSCVQAVVNRWDLGKLMVLFEGSIEAAADWQVEHADPYFRDQPGIREWLIKSIRRGKQ